jgi:transcriptional regulator with XRE-family HTH domain
MLADAEVNRSNSQTIGLLDRLNVRVLSVSHIGKETNLLEQQEEGTLVADPQAVYLDGGGREAIRPHLDRVSISELSARSGVSERMLRYLRRGERRASEKTLEAIDPALVRMLDAS